MCGTFDKLSSMISQNVTSFTVPPMSVELDSSSDHLIDGKLKSLTKTVQAVSGFSLREWLSRFRSPWRKRVLEKYGQLVDSL